MESRFVFNLAPADDALLPQLSRVLAQRTEIRSREAYPRLWDVTDRLNDRHGSAPFPDGPSRPRRIVFSVILLLLGLFLFLPFVLEPQNLMFPGTVGTLAVFLGAAFLWRCSKPLLAGLMLPAGGLLTLGAVLNVEDLGRFLPVGAAGLALGIAALFVRKRPSTSKFDRAARQLIDARSELSSTVTVSFGPDGITTPESALAPYANLDGVFESEDLFLVELAGKFLLLQKRELIQGDPKEFRAFLTEKMK